MPRFALALVLLATVVAAAPVPKDKKVEPYPFGVGTKWEYIRNGDEKNVWTEQIIESTEKDGVRTVVIESTPPRGRKTTEKFEVKDGAVWLVESGIAGKCDPPASLWQAGLKEGDTWTNEYKLSGGPVKEVVRVGKAEEITTPAGKFTVLPLVFTTEVPKDSPSYTGWYSEEVGLVRHTYDGDKEAYQELKAFTPPKK